MPLEVSFFIHFVIIVYFVVILIKFYFKNRTILGAKPYGPIGSLYVRDTLAASFDYIPDDFLVNSLSLGTLSAVIGKLTSPL